MESVDRGDVDQMSFGFLVNEEEWEHKKDGTSIRTLKDVELIEVSAVTFPAYPDTTIALRSLKKSTAEAEPKLAEADEIVPAPKRWSDEEKKMDAEIYWKTEVDKHENS
jgi:phage head maturation protease